MFDKGFLSDVRRRALRKGIWFRALDTLERGILLLSAQVVNSVRSSLLTFQLVKILAKLKNASKSGFLNHLERFGLERVRAVQVQAEAFGSERVKGLVGDFGFVRYLMFLDYNQPICWRIYS
jgi:hypothetical protein